MGKTWFRRDKLRAKREKPRKTRKKYIEKEINGIIFEKPVKTFSKKWKKNQEK